MKTQTLFPQSVKFPSGFNYYPAVVSEEEEDILLAHIEQINLGSFLMRDAIAKRQVKQFGWAYSFVTGELTRSTPIPEFLMPLRVNAALRMGIDPELFTEALVTKYPVGAPIGWHSDVAVFGAVAGISLMNGCRMKLRLVNAPREVISFEAEARSLYTMNGVARYDWQHSIPPVKFPRYSVTFRTLKVGARIVGQTAGKSIDRRE